MSILIKREKFIIISLILMLCAVVEYHIGSGILIGYAIVISLELFEDTKMRSDERNLGIFITWLLAGFSLTAAWAVLLIGICGLVIGFIAEEDLQERKETEA